MVDVKVVGENYARDNSRLLPSRMELIGSLGSLRDCDLGQMFSH
jgi:hypothetical protein